MLIGQIKPYWRNPRINQATIDPLKESIKSFGFNQPILVDKNWVVIAGHSRLKAAMQLEMAEVPVIVLDMTPAQAKAYRIADNKVGENTKWDFNMLIPELREIENIEIMQAYFPEVDLPDLLKETAGTSNFTMPTQQEIEEATQEAESRFGDAYNETKEAVVDVTCPHCGEQFGIDSRASQFKK
jgi:hypothetical protein